MAHDYQPTCQCFRCKGIRNDPRHRAPVTRPRIRRRYRTQYATREEQQARLLDCGPLAWDDRD